MPEISSAEIGRDVAAEARAWEGTPFHWQQSTKGPEGGCDCKGLVAGVAGELGLEEAGSLYGQMAAYRRGRVDSRLLIEGLAALFDKVPAGDPGQPGDILALKIELQPRHLAIDVGEGEVAVALEPTPRVKIVTRRALLRTLPLHSAWRWRARSGR